MSTVSKGKGYEREMRRALLDHGFPARRTPRSGATAWAKGDIEFLPAAVRSGMWSAEEYSKRDDLWRQFDWDTETRISRPDIRRVECKRRKVPSWLKDCLEHDVVCLREDRGETVVVMKLDTWLELMK